jgi:protein tyrosine/serine phosphatase
MKPMSEPGMRRLAIGIWRWAARAARILAAVVLAATGYAAHCWATGNLHVVEPGRLFRSGQPSPEQLANWRARYGIVNVLNLRGANPGADWYEAEKTAAAALGVTLIDYGMSAKRDLTPAQVESILGILDGLTGPTLIHCRSGVDRTGIVSALYLAHVVKAGEFAAELQLSPVYGHLPLSLSPFYAMDRSFEAAEPRLGFHDS